MRTPRRNTSAKASWVCALVCPLLCSLMLAMHAPGCQSTKERAMQRLHQADVALRGFCQELRAGASWPPDGRNQPAFRYEEQDGPSGRHVRVTGDGVAACLVYLDAGTVIRSEFLPD